MKRRTHGIALALALGVVLALAFASVALASQATDITINGGTNTITSPIVADFSAIQLDGAAHSVTATMNPFTVVDARGTGAGWHVTVQASQFAEYSGDAYVNSGKQLPMDSLSMPAPTVVKGTTTSNTVPTLTDGPYTIDHATPIQIASATNDTGMGTYIFTPSDLTLSVGANVYAHTYRSDVTVSVLSGP